MYKYKWAPMVVKYTTVQNLWRWSQKVKWLIVWDVFRWENWLKNVVGQMNLQIHTNLEEIIFSEKYLCNN